MDVLYLDILSVQTSSAYRHRQRRHHWPHVPSCSTYSLQNTSCLLPGFPGEQEIRTPVPTCSLTVSSPVWLQSLLEYRYSAVHGPRWSISLSEILSAFCALQWSLAWPPGRGTAASRCVVSEVTLLRSRCWHGFPHLCNPVQAADSLCLNVLTCKMEHYQNRLHYYTPSWLPGIWIR